MTSFVGTVPLRSNGRTVKEGGDRDIEDFGDHGEAALRRPGSCPFRISEFCWNVTPSRCAKLSCDMRAISRCARMDAPTWLSASVGRLFSFCSLGVLRLCLKVFSCGGLRDLWEEFVKSVQS